MLGASLYLSEGIEKNKQLLQEMNDSGIKRVFTSMHIPEDDPETTLGVFEVIMRITAELGMDVIVDVSSHTAEQYDLKDQSLEDFLFDLGIRTIRVDYGFSINEMAKLAQRFQLVLNASTIDEAYCMELEETGIELTSLTVCHNYYPRENTGLDRTFFLKRNQYLKEKGFSVMAFIAGDDEKRGPVYAGLPTLEEHRYIEPLEAYLDLTRNGLVDEVMIGDISLMADSKERLMKWVNENIYLLPVDIMDEEKLPPNFYDVHSNRPDVAADVVRASQSRIDLKKLTIQPFHCIPRDRGCVTIDNMQYGRYAGEIQLTKKDLPQDERVNVLARVNEKVLGVIDYIGPEEKFQFQLDKK